MAKSDRETIEMTAFLQRVDVLRHFRNQLVALGDSGNLDLLANLGSVDQSHLELELTKAVRALKEA